MIITIGGNIGSGKTTLAQKIAQELDLRYISAGQAMRKMAKEKKMSLGEFSEYAEENPEIDQKIDKRQKELAQKGDCVVDGRLSAFFLNPDLKIWLKAPLEVRKKRIKKRESLSAEEAEKKIIERERSERERYKKFYGINLNDLQIYDLVLDTAKFSSEELKEISLVAIEKIK